MPHHVYFISLVFQLAGSEDPCKLWSALLRLLCLCGQPEGGEVIVYDWDK